jgi:predicted transcriptional regulator
VAQEVARKRIQKFKQDVDLLVSKGFSQDAIAQKMGVAGPNFSAYVNESNTITGQFLIRFYNAWATELEPGSGGEFDDEVAEIYRIHDTIVEKLVDGQNRLINSNVALVEYNQKLMDLIIRHGIPPEAPKGQ